MTDDPIIYTPRKRRLSRVPPEEYQWRSRGRVAYGKITVLDGDPSVGKSTITLDWAAAETRGWDYCDPAPQDQREEKWTKRGVVILAAEDGVGDTILPRFVAASGDPEQVIVLDMVRTEYRAVEGGMGEIITPYPIQIPDDLPTLMDALDDVDAGLLLADPLITFLGADTTKDQEVRHALSPLAQALDTFDPRRRTGKTALVALRHQTKGSLGGPSLYRGGGSIGIVALARIGLVVGKDPHDPTGRQRILATNKVNNAAEAESQGYTLETAPNNPEVATVNWTGPSEHTADSLGRAALTPEDLTELVECKEWLAATLRREFGQQMVIKEIEKLGREQGFSPTLLKQARHALGCKRVVPRDQPMWRLP